MRTWKLQEAKAKLSILINNALYKGPQTIMAEEKPIAVILSTAEYEKLAGRKQSFVEFMRRSPLVDSKIQLSRAKSNCRDE